MLGVDHRDTLTTLSNLAKLLAVSKGPGNRREALDLCRQALEARERTLGRHHPKTLTSINNLAMLHLRRGEVGEAAQLFREVVDERRRDHGPEHPSSLLALGNLAVSLTKLGDAAAVREARSLRADEARTKEAVYGADHPLARQARRRLVRASALMIKIEHAVDALGDKKLQPKNAH